LLTPQFLWKLNDSTDKPEKIAKSDFHMLWEYLSLVLAWLQFSKYNKWKTSWKKTVTGGEVVVIKRKKPYESFAYPLTSFVQQSDVEPCRYSTNVFETAFRDAVVCQ
jgi:hypothetical protein